MVRKDDIIKLLEEQARTKRENRLKSFKPYPKQLEFIAATKDHNEVVLQAGNQVGKSEAGAYLTAIHLTGLYPEWWPGRVFDHPTRAWAAGEVRSQSATFSNGSYAVRLAMTANGERA